ncbi:MAG: phosphocholine cytidylyltransferase family protein [Bacteroidaceae bacterium]|nr:phosphocholine cytidylyltransferase family protein [Bacteroidaceae bacterium]
MVRTAVIMAAGLGTRFGKMTETQPKGFIEVGGMSMIRRSVETLLACGIERIIIGTGYKKECYEELAGQYPQIECVYSPRYAETNSMYTLYNCREAIGDDDFLLLESDIVFNSAAIAEMLSDEHDDIMLITPVIKFQDQYYVMHDEKGVLVACSTDKSALDAQGELVGIHRISSLFYKKMCGEYARVVDEKPKLGYEYMLLEMSRFHVPVHVLNSRVAKWYEIDDEDDLRYAEENVVKYLQ